MIPHRFRRHDDSITHSQLRPELIDQVSVDHVMLGSDDCFDLGYERPREIIQGPKDERGRQGQYPRRQRRPPARPVMNGRASVPHVHRTAPRAAAGQLALCLALVAAAVRPAAGGTPAPAPQTAPQSAQPSQTAPAAAPSTAPIGSPGLRVTLLGTGTPEPIVERFGPSTLVQAGGETLLFDLGRGASQRLWQLGLPLSSVTAAFITHLHSDHVVGLPDVWLTGWTAPPYGRRRTPFRLYGPRGTRAMAAALEQAFAEDIRIRMEDERLPKEGVTIAAEDVVEGVVFDRNGVKVTGFLVDHGPAIRPALGYRIDYGGHAVAIAGDTRATENLVTVAAGVDVLIHPMAIATAGTPMEPTVRIHFATPEEAGTTFRRVAPKLGVYNHVILLGDPPPTLEQIVTRTRTTYTGPLAVGHDLMVIDVGDAVTTRTVIP